jgi:hypothetical protein
VFRRRAEPQDIDLAKYMRGFFRDLTLSQRADPEAVATAYGRHLFITGRGVIDRESLNAGRSRFYVGLSTRDDDLEYLTKRATLIADTLVLSHGEKNPYYSVRDGTILDPGESARHRELQRDQPAIWSSREQDRPTPSQERKIPHNARVWDLPEDLGIHCPDLRDLGKWILRAESLICSGMTWYLPEYVGPGWLKERERDPMSIRFSRPVGPGLYQGDVVRESNTTRLINFLVQDGRIVDVSGDEPLKSRLVRPVLRVNLPAIDGVGLREFAKIVLGEFDSYAGFRDYLRGRFLDLDNALGDEQSEIALARIGLEIADEVRGMQAQVNKLRRKRAVAASGAAVGSMGAMLVAVYGPAFQEAIAAIGASGGIWAIVHALAENSPRQLRNDKWYFAWVISRQFDRMA